MLHIVLLNVGLWCDVGQFPVIIPVVWCRHCISERALNAESAQQGKPNRQTIRDLSAISSYISCPRRSGNRPVCGSTQGSGYVRPEPLDDHIRGDHLGHAGLRAPPIPVRRQRREDLGLFRCGSTHAHFPCNREGNWAGEGDVSLARDGRPPAMPRAFASSLTPASPASRICV